MLLLENNLSLFLDAQRGWFAEALQKKSCATLKEKASELIQNPFCQNNDLAQAYAALIANYCGDSHPFIQECEQRKEPRFLFQNEYFSWEPLPYPRYHAELAALFFLLADAYQNETLLKYAEKMAFWHLNTLDYDGYPFFSLWAQQEASCADLLWANSFLFGLAARYYTSDLLKKRFSYLYSKQQELLLSFPNSSSVLLNLVIAQGFSFEENEFSLEQKIEDTQHLLFGDRNAQKSFYCTGKGCKSGLGAFFNKNLGVVNFGPQLLPLTNFQTFGVIGKTHHDSAQKYHFSSKLVDFSEKKTSFTDLKEASFAGFWLDSELSFQEKCLSINTHLKGLHSFNRAAFVFFLKAQNCLVNNSTLKPRSLDRFRGTTKKVSAQHEQESFIIESTQEMSVEVIPLAKERFWGADFLIAYFLKDSDSSWKLYF